MMAPPGLSALGAKGSVRDRLTPPGRVEGFRPREVYSIAALARWALSAPFFISPLATKTIQPAYGQALTGLRVQAPSALGFKGVKRFRGWRWAPLIYRRRPLMKKPLQLHLLKRVPPACKGERTMRWRGRPPIGGQDSDRVSHRCSAPYTLLPLRGISPQGETRNLRRKTESYILKLRR